jgi:hypothetical protein
MTVAAAAAFKDSALPFIGNFSRIVDIALTSGDKPAPSLPIRRQTFFGVQSRL